VAQEWQLDDKLIISPSILEQEGRSSRYRILKRKMMLRDDFFSLFSQMEGNIGRRFTILMKSMGSNQSQNQN
jgi:hypothetical protein